MRKGRSQRKARETRGSLPALSKRPASLAVGAGTDPGPKVVIGLTSPRSSEESVDTRETRGPETGDAGAFDRATTRLELVREESLELVREESLELVREESLELVRDTQETDRPADVESVGDVDSLAGVEREPLSESDPFASEPLLRALGLDLGHDETPETQETPADEISIPPIGDLSPRTLEPIAERFFSEGELVAAHPPLPGEDEAWDTAQDKAQRKSLPHVVERRQRFARYVRWAVGTAAVVCVAALARTAISPAAVSSMSRSASAAAALDTRGAAELKAAAPLVTAPAPTQPTTPEPAAATLVTPLVTPPVTPPATTPAEAQMALVEAPKVDVPKAAEPVTPSAPAPGDKTALQEKNDARRALERGKLADAIAAGERSVALDPLDGEAWLLLGASYQEKGKNAEARRCYTSCVTEGKRGPIGECRAMLH